MITSDIDSTSWEFITKWKLIYFDFGFSSRIVIFDFDFDTVSSLTKNPKSDRRSEIGSLILKSLTIQEKANTTRKSIIHGIVFLWLIQEVEDIENELRDVIYI